MSAIASNRKVLALISLVGLLETAEALAADRWRPNTLEPVAAPSPLPADGTVEFPTESPIGVTFRRRTKEQFPSTPLDEYPAQLHAAQQGNAVAARTIGNWMAICGRLRGVPFSTANTVTSSPIPPAKGQSARASAMREFCERRTEEEIASGVTWLQAAAASGDVAALRRLTMLYRPGSAEEVGALNALWRQQGSLRTLHQLAEVHGWRSLHYSAESGDAIFAMASHWLYAKLSESAWRQDSSISAFIEALGRDVNSRFDSASPQMRTEAIAAARKMLVESAGCCVP